MSIYINCVRCGVICCPNPANQCNDCVTAMPVSCICCGNNFLATIKEMDHMYHCIGGYTKCKTCKEISCALTTGNNLAIVTIDPNKKIRITYDVEQIGYDGDGSEPDEEEFTDDHEEQTFEYPILTTITESVITEYMNNQNIAFSPINYYTQPSGYSIGVRYGYTMKDIKIV